MNIVHNEIFNFVNNFGDIKSRKEKKGAGEENKFVEGLRIFLEFWDIQTIFGQGIKKIRN